MTIIKCKRKNEQFLICAMLATNSFVDDNSQNLDTNVLFFIILYIAFRCQYDLAQSRGDINAPRLRSISQIYLGSSHIDLRGKIPRFIITYKELIENFSKKQLLKYAQDKPELREIIINAVNTLKLEDLECSTHGICYPFYYNNKQLKSYFILIIFIWRA